MFLGCGGVHLDWVFPPALSLERLRLRPDQASQFMRRGGHSPQPGFPSPYCAERFRQMIVAGCKNYTGGIPAVQHVLTKRIRGLKRLKGHPEPGSSAGGQRRVGRSNSGAVPHGCPQTPCRDVWLLRGPLFSRSRFSLPSSFSTSAFETLNIFRTAASMRSASVLPGRSVQVAVS